MITSSTAPNGSIAPDGILKRRLLQCATGLGINQVIASAPVPGHSGFAFDRHAVKFTGVEFCFLSVHAARHQWGTGDSYENFFAPTFRLQKRTALASYRFSSILSFKSSSRDSLLQEQRK
eukprot:2769654-Amphidinium_carterae.1